MPKVLKISWHQQALARRLQRHALAAPLKNAHPADAAAAMCGVHTQILSAAELSIAIRTTNVTHADIHDALWKDHTLIKTFGPRGTVHLLAAKDLPMWTGALSAIPGQPTTLPKGMAMTPEQTEAVLVAIGDSLKDAELTVDELNVEVIKRAGAWAGDLVMPAFQTWWPRWRQSVGRAAHRGVLCFGPNKGRNVTYTNPARWLPKFKPANPKTAVADLLKNYLHAYGPATPAQFAQWLAASPKWAAELFRSNLVQQIDIDNNTAWIAAGDAKFPKTKPVGVRLLPYFDAYVVGSHPRELVYPGRAKERAMARGQAGNFPVLLINGVVAGVWHLARSAKKIAITVEPFAKLTATQRAELDDQVTRIAEFLEAKPSLKIGMVSVGAHA
jgi:hypothetical protein